MTDQNTADNVAEFFERFDEIASPGVQPEGFKESTRIFTEKVVENGTITPDANVSARFDISVKDRLTGKTRQDVTAVLSLGIMIGTALERDIPKDSNLEGVWRDGGFEMPKDP